MAVLACGCSERPHEVRAVPPHGEEIEFRFQPAFEDATRIWLARFPSGEIACVSSRIPLAADSDEPKRASTLTEKKISLPEYEAFARALEDPALWAAAEQDEGAGIDGTAWIFGKKAGGRSIDLCFWMPERKPDDPRSKLVISLGERFAMIAGLTDVLPTQKKGPTSSPSQTR